MSPRLALAKPLTGSGHGSGALKKKGDLWVAFLDGTTGCRPVLLSRTQRQANSLSYFLIATPSIGLDLETHVAILNRH
jgi:hypothetical protein